MKGLPAAAALDELRVLAGGKLTGSVDMIWGTSVGGILGALAASEAPGPLTEFFTDDGKKIFKSVWFRHWPKYPAKPIETALKLRLGDLTLNDCSIKLGVTALDRTNQAPFMFKSYDTRNLVVAGATPLWQVGRATSAAQRYFPAYRYGIKYLWDGGNIANNPAACALADARQIWKDEEIKMLVLGCGSDPIILPWWIPRWLQDLILTIGMQFSTGAEEVDYQMEAELGDMYRIIQPEFDGNAELDGALPADLARLEAAAKRMVTQAESTLKWFLK